MTRSAGASDVATTEFGQSGVGQTRAWQSWADRLVNDRRCPVAGTLGQGFRNVRLCYPHTDKHDYGSLYVTFDGITCDIQ